MKTHFFSALCMGVVLFFSSCDAEDLISGDLGINDDEAVETAARYYDSDLVVYDRWTEVSISPFNDLSKYKLLGECSSDNGGTQIINTQTDIFVKMKLYNRTNKDITLTNSSLQAWQHYSETGDVQRPSYFVYDEDMMSGAQTIPANGSKVVYAGFRDIFLNLGSYPYLSNLCHLEFGIKYNSKFVFTVDMPVRWKYTTAGWD